MGARLACRRGGACSATGHGRGALGAELGGGQVRRRRSSGRPPRTASRTPCRTSRRRGSRCCSSGRSRRSSSHLEPVDRVEDSGAIGAERASTRRLATATRGRRSTAVTDATGPHPRPPYQTASGPSADGRAVRRRLRSWPRWHRLAASEVLVVAASDRHRRRPGRLSRAGPSGSGRRSERSGRANQRRVPRPRSTTRMRSDTPPSGSTSSPADG